MLLVIIAQVSRKVLAQEGESKKTKVFKMLTLNRKLIFFFN